MKSLRLYYALIFIYGAKAFHKDCVRDFTMYTCIEMCIQVRTRKRN